MEHRESRKNTTRIAFYLEGGDAWQAGTVYLRGLFCVLQEMYGDSVTIQLVLRDAKQQVPEELDALVDDLITYPAPKRWTPAWAVDRAATWLLRYDLNKNLALRRHGVHVIALGESPSGTRIPSLSWLPDFQHIHLPEMFSMRERKNRDRGYIELARQAARVILLSEAVRRDFEAFAPQYAHKARIVRPTSYIPTSIYESEPKPIADQYYLPEKFVYLPNQFWKHKNHGVVFQALKILKEKGLQVFVVCSGNQQDYRHPKYFVEVLQQVSQLGVENQVAFLGLIPWEHVLILMRQTVCVLNPSLFEGYGMTVDEARSVGKQALLSDIPAHREQNVPKGVFFSPHDCEDLAEELAQLWLNTAPGPDTKLETEARHALPGRLRAYAESFISVVREVSGGAEDQMLLSSSPSADHIGEEECVLPCTE